MFMKFFLIRSKKFKLQLLLVIVMHVAGILKNNVTAQTNNSLKLNDPKLMEWRVKGITRKAMVYIPTAVPNEPMPVIFAFHGHGGTMGNIYNTRRFDKLWPEAIFICPQGLNTPGALTDPEGKSPGWQMDDQETNKDLQFFDAMLNTLKNDYKIDQKRIYVTGHSNGGGFTYLLWATRGDVFAGVAPTASVAGRLITKIKPKPAFHLVGETDPLVKPQWQKRTYMAVMKLNKCSLQGEKIDQFTTLYSSESGNPFVLFTHSAGHQYPIGANEAILTFFKSIK